MFSGVCGWISGSYDDLLKWYRGVIMRIFNEILFFRLFFCYLIDMDNMLVSFLFYLIKIVVNYYL